nr:hypothetical protein [Prochlorococcus marinus]|tara:strand:+ start:74 stop:460 length:387 start_codon:yes stop_codon:yes gene_type:complete
MKKNKVLMSFQKSIIFFIPLLVTSCVGGATTINSTDGSKIRFKSENVTCKNSVEYPDYFGIGFSGKRRNVECTANGVRTFLTGDRTNFSEKKICKVIDERGVEQDAVISRNNKNSFACLAATKFRKLK